MSDIKLDYNTYYTTTDGNFRYYITILSFHTMRLQSYRDNWELEEIIIFETFLSRSKRFGHTKFFYQQKKLMKECRVSEYKLRQTKNKLEELGILSVERGNHKEDHKNYYTINFDAIIRNLDKIYDFDKAPDGDEDTYKELFEKFYHNFKHDRYFSYDDASSIANNIQAKEQKDRHQQRKSQNGTEAKGYNIYS